MRGRNGSAPIVENREYAQFAARIMRGMAKRAGGDVELLPALRRLQSDVDELMRASVAECRAEGYSWSEIAQRLGITKQAAQQRYGREPRGSLASVKARLTLDRAS